jgi:hypothetical protein
VGLFSYCSMSERNHKGPITTLGHALDAGIMLWIFCRNCGRAVKQHPWVWSQRLGPAPLDVAAGKSRCSKCGSRDCLLIPSKHTVAPPDKQNRRAMKLISGPS